MPNRKLSVAKTLRANGVLGVVRTYVTGGGRYDPSTGKANARGSSSSDSVRAMMLMDQLTKTPSRSYGSTGNTEEVNTLVEGVQKWALVDAMGSAPKMQDHIVVGDDTWHIINVQTVSDKTGAVLYVLALRR